MATFLNVCTIAQHTCGGWSHYYGDELQSGHPLYTAAVLETDWSNLPERIRAVESAITNRLHEFSLDHGGTPDENQAIMDVMHRLAVLRSDLVLWREPKAKS